MDPVNLVIWIGIIAVVLIAAYAIMTRVTMDPAMRNLIMVALIVVLAVIVIIFLLRLGGVSWPR